MALTQRKTRPLARDKSDFRDDRLFIIACDDTHAPKQYFNFFKIVRVKIEVLETPLDQSSSSSASYVIDRLLEFKEKYGLEDYDELWVLLDTDHYITGTHLKSYIQAIKNAKQANFKIALSRPCFEFWLLLHHVEITDKVLALSNANAVAKALRKALGGEYNKNKLKAEHYPFAAVSNACLRASQLDQNTAGGDIPETNTSRVYLLLQAIVSKSTSQKLPPELQTLRSQI